MVAGYEGAARIVHSMDMTEEAAQRVTGNSISVFAAAGAAGWALGLGEGEMLSTLGMAGIYTPVPGMYKWARDEGLTPRKDIKQGWAWMCMAGTFAAVSAQHGLKALQENNILDGDRGLWRMLGMDILKEERITTGLGETYEILQFGTKSYPGVAATHAAIVAVTALVKDNGIDVADIEEIQVITNKGGAIGFDDQEPSSLCDMEFSMPYQISAALLAGESGPGWYMDSTVESLEVSNMMKRVVLSFDDECEPLFRERRIHMSKVSVFTKAGKRYARNMEQPKQVRSADEIRNKFITTTSQVIGRYHLENILSTVDNLEALGGVSELIGLLHVPSGVQRTL